MGRTVSVLLIDDDPAVLMTLQAFLEDSGYRVTCAGDGEAGLKLFASLQPDVVVTDLRMPKLDGFGVITAIKAEKPETPVIALTAAGERQILDQVVELGGWCCLFKPLPDLNALIAAIELATGGDRAEETP